MGWDLTEVTYEGFRTADGWEVVVRRPGQPLRLLDLPQRPTDWARIILTNYFGGDELRAAELHHDFAALTIRRFSGDWELSGRDIDNALREVEILRARLRIALARG